VFCLYKVLSDGLPFLKSIRVNIISFDSQKGVVVEGRVVIQGHDEQGVCKLKGLLKKVEETANGF
jgi:hypothetical protein